MKIRHGLLSSCTVRPYQVFYSKILATLLPVIYCKNALILKLTKNYNLLVLVHFYNTVASNLL